MEKYSNLMDIILSRPNLLSAYKQVVSNKGSAGIDGMKCEDLMGYLRTDWDRIRAELKNGSYIPQAVKGVEIPKPSGGKRLLGIPTVIDRFIQQAIHQVVSRIWEPHFSKFSYGFRPVMRAHFALQQAQAYINEGYQDVIDLDLKSFFDRVNHDKLMALLKQKITDKVLLRLIRRYLQSGILIGGVVSSRAELPRAVHLALCYPTFCLTNWIESWKSGATDLYVMRMTAAFSCAVAEPPTESKQASLVFWKINFTLKSTKRKRRSADPCTSSYWAMVLYRLTRKANGENTISGSLPKVGNG